MKAIIKIQNVFDEILEETTPELVITSGKKTFIGALFFPREKWEKPRKVLEQIEAEGEPLKILLSAYALLKRHNMTKADDRTFKTMVHWQYINGFSDEMATDNYKFQNDTDYINYLKAAQA